MVDGCLRSAVKVGDYVRIALQAVVDPRVRVENGYSVWTIEYWTGGRTSLGTVTIPLGAAPPRGFAIVANAHGTVGVDDPCKLAGTVLGAGMAGLFGARGMIGVAPDYPGLGTPGTLPYLVSEVEGRAALDALRAARELALRERVPVSNRFAVAGLSEGGHATLAAAALHAKHARDLDVRAFGVAAPASVYEEHWRAGFVDGPLVPFHAMLVFAWAEHYGHKGAPVWADGAEPFVRQTMASQCVGANGTWGGLGALGTSRARVFAPAFINAYQSGRWGDEYRVFRDAFAANRIVPFVPAAPIKIWQGDADWVVPEPTTHGLVDTLRAGGARVEYEVVHGATHFDLAFGPLGVHEQRTEASIAWLRGLLDAP
jgi:dienelactone hydrolase